MDISLCRVAAYINLKNAVHNYNAVKACLAPDAHLFPVIKADGYGHGAVRLSRIYEQLGAPMFCVAGIDEAVDLRNNGCKLPILVLGPTHPDLTSEIISYDLCQTVHSHSYADDLSKNIPAGKKMKIHIKLDTGMRRIGFTDGTHPEKILERPEFCVCGVFTHFAESDDMTSDFTKVQLERFSRMTRPFEGKDIVRHAANSAAVLCRPETHLDGVRPGIVLYGHYPSQQIKEEFEKKGQKLLPLMSFKSHLTHVFDVKKGESIGYSRKFFAQQDMTVATVCAGYADGVPRLLSNKGKVGIKGKMCNIVGNVCMDQFMIDVSGLDVKPYDEVVIFGEGGPSCEEVAQLCGTISYELCCSVTKRVNRVYIGD